MSSCMSPWPWRPTPMQPKASVSLGAGRWKTRAETIVGAARTDAVAAAAVAAVLRKSRRERGAR